MRVRSGLFVIAAAGVAAISSVAVATGSPSGASPASHARSASTAAGPILPGTTCPSFPADAVWNTPITTLPVDTNSAKWLAAMAASSTNLHPDYGPSGTKYPYGIPWNTVTNATPLSKIKFQYASQSDPGPYPFTSTTPIEGGPTAGGDRHAIMVNTQTCELYELWHARYVATGDTAGSGAIWASLNSDNLRPAGWTSADAAGLPVLPLLVNYDEVASGAMDHAIRVTTQCSSKAYLWPARHEAGSSNTSCPPMGARFRLNASFNLPSTQCGKMCQTVITTMKTYGLIIADNGSNWYFQGTADTRWTYTQVDQLKNIPASQFVAVNEACMQVSANSAQAYQPGTAGYIAHCG